MFHLGTLPVPMWNTCCSHWEQERSLWEHICSWRCSLSEHQMKRTSMKSLSLLGLFVIHSSITGGYSITSGFLISGCGFWESLFVDVGVDVEVDE